MKATLVLLAVALAAGCASTPVPADKYARARASITSAEVMNAEQVPNAAVHLRVAREELQRAKDLLRNGDNDLAAIELLRAEADANASMNLARETWAKRDAAETIDRVNQLKAQMEVPQQ